MHSFVTAFLGLLCCSGLSWGINDTLFVEQKVLNYAVQSVASDSLGTVFIASARGVEVWKTDRFEVLDPHDFSGVASLSGVVVSHQAFIESTGVAPNEVYASWRSHIPSSSGPKTMTAADNKDGLWWVCDGKNLYQFRISDNNQTLLSGQSIRGMSFGEDHWIAATYSGLFLDGQRICPDLDFSEGNVIVDGTRVIAFGYGVAEFALDHPEGCLVIHAVEDSTRRAEGARNHQVGRKWRGEVWVGGCNGLGKWEDNQFVPAYPNMDVRNLVEVENGLLLLTADKGVLHFDGNQICSTGIDMPCVDLVPWKQEKWLLATDWGLGIWDKSSQKLTFVTQDDGMLSNGVCNLFVDEYETVWMSTLSGIHRYQEGVGIIQIVHPRVEFNRFSFARSPDGSLHFGSVEGIFRIAPPTPPPHADDHSTWVLILVAFAGLLVIWSLSLRSRLRTSRDQNSVENRQLEIALFTSEVTKAALSGLPNASVSTIAAAMRMSERHFYRKSAEFGIKPGALIKAVKVERALLLVDAGEPFDEVARQVGYTTSYLKQLVKAQVIDEPPE